MKYAKIEQNMLDLKKIYPSRLTIGTKEVEKSVGRSGSSLFRDRLAATKGIRYIQSSKFSEIIYPLREIAISLFDSRMIIKKDLLISWHMQDLEELFPGRVTLRMSDVMSMRGTSRTTLYREKYQENGITHIDESWPTMYAIRDIAEWLATTRPTCLTAGK